MAQESHFVTFFPVGNADSTLIKLANGGRILVDFAATGDPDNPDDHRCDLPELLREELGDDSSLDVLAITHLDLDHYVGCSEFFYLEHAKKYQGGERVRIKELWVPAAVLTEAAPEHPEAKILQKEARHRFKTGKGIRVFSRPERLEKYCTDSGIDFESKRSLLAYAGTVVDGFSLSEHGVQFFVHAPFRTEMDDRGVEERNEDSLVLHATFSVDGGETRLFLTADAPYELLETIVDITKSKNRDERLQWDILSTPHHTSYKSLGPDKGTDETEATDKVNELYKKANQGAYIVSSSKPIPARGSKEDKDVQPPHRQAATYYKKIVASGHFLVTMEHPRKSAPEPIVFEISSQGATHRKRSGITGGGPPRGAAPKAGQ